MLILQQVSYLHPNKELLFDNIDLTVNHHEKIALIGNNGTGKSTLLKIIAGELAISGGQLNVHTEPYYMPQIFGQFNHLTVAQALNIDKKWKALKDILNGHATEDSFNILNDDWTLEERCKNALQYWQLSDLDLSQKMETLSGGQKTKVLLAGISIHEPKLVLLDEPSNHLDIQSRKLLYDFIQSSQCSLIVVSHDRKLLNLLSKTCELSKHNMKVYGGNYDFYAEQKQLDENALNRDVQGKEKELRKAKEKERETLERQQKRETQGQKSLAKASIAPILAGRRKESSENTASKMKDIHAEKVGGVLEELLELRSALPDMDKMKLGFDHSKLHKGKILFTVKDVNFSYDAQHLWPESLNFQITSGERIALNGANGSGKTTLINLLLGHIEPQIGTIYRANNDSVYIDQDYSLIDNSLNVYEQAQKFNSTALQEHEVKMNLSRFLFTKETWDKPCHALSGGERMRLTLCCLTINRQPPDSIILDEPTNNLDIQNVKILTNAVNEYQGTLMVVSHDETFLEQINVKRIIQL
jgi:ATPase subunit of ABC transporter with duplicated ATPase domains